MSQFDQLIGEQLKTMDKFLFLQSEIERCQEIEQELIRLQNETDLQSVQEEIKTMKAEPREIFLVFEKQTEDLIKSYQDRLTTIG